MPRRYRRRIVNRDKYSVEQTVVKAPATWTTVEAGEFTQQNYQTDLLVVPPSSVQGMRKVKHLTVSFSSQSDSIMVYALVYVPLGYDANTINYPSQGNAISTYEPNQYVMSTGVLDFTGGPLRIRTPLSRNLNSGDSIHLILATESVSPTLVAQVKYAITLQ